MPSELNNEVKLPIDVTEVGTTVNVNSSQNVRFVDETQDWATNVKSDFDPTFHISDTQDVPLGEFLSRPVRIGTFEWSPAAGPRGIMNIDPWTAFLDNPQVKARINNFALYRSTLKVKFVVNGNAFLYGTLIAFYHPLPTEDDFKLEPVVGLYTDEGALVTHSQKPHVYIYPTNSQGATLHLPFIFPYNYVNLVSRDFVNLGHIHVWEVNKLVQSLGHSASVSVNIFAWAEDVCLAVPTSQVIPAPSIASSQAGDEYAQKPVSKTANAVAVAANALVDVPVIGPYARVTGMVSTMVGKFAALFGYSRPAIVQDIVPYKPMYFGNLSNTNAGDTSQKLTFDLKQEVTVDPRVVGLSNIDEMSIRYLASREAYIGTSTYSSTTPLDGRILGYGVTPMLWRSGSSSQTTAITPGMAQFMTPCCFAALPFKYWRGTLKFRFQIVGTPFHKGRLRFVWDPVLLAEVAYGGPPKYKTTASFNVAYSTVIDIATTRDFTLEIGWGQVSSFLSTKILPGRDYNPIFTDSHALVNHDFVNGYLCAYVLNELVGPSDSAVTAVYVNTFVSCPDLEVFDPSSDNLRLLSYNNPTGLKLNSSEEDAVAQSQGGYETLLDTPELMAPLANSDTKNVVMGPIKPQGVDHTVDVYYGDPLVSFRTLLKRYNFFTTFVCDFTVHNAPQYARITKWNLCDFPSYYGPQPDAWGHAVQQPPIPSPFAMNFCKFTYLNYFTAAFVVRRGGIRWKYSSCRLVSSPPYEGHLTVQRGSDGTSMGVEDYSFTFSADEQSNPLNRKITDLTVPGVPGYAKTPITKNPVLEVELPYYQKRRFASARANNMSVPGDAGYTGQTYHSVTLLHGEQTAVGITCLTCECAAADDYSLNFFIGAPPIYYYGFYTGEAVANLNTFQSPP